MSFCPAIDYRRSHRRRVESLHQSSIIHPAMTHLSDKSCSSRVHDTRCIILLTCAILLGLSSPLAFANEDHASDASITFSGTSTLHDFKGNVRAKSFVIHAAPSPRGIQYSADIDVPVREMKTGDEDRDDNMYEMFEEEKFPTIRGSIKNALISPGGGPAEMRIQIRNKEQSIPVTISKWKMTAGSLSFQIQFRLSLKKSGLEAPSVLGFIKVDDRVDVVADVTAGAPR